MVAKEEILSPSASMSDKEDIYSLSLVSAICDEFSAIINCGLPFFMQNTLCGLMSQFDRKLVNDKWGVCQVSEDHFTKFQSSLTPEVSVHQYLQRIQKYSKCSDACFVFVLIYVDRLIVNKNLKLTDLNIHRLLITSIMLAAKFHDDLFYNNAFYAKLGGLSLAELNKLEVELLSLLDFSLVVSSATYNEYFSYLDGKLMSPSLSLSTSDIFSTYSPFSSPPPPCTYHPSSPQIQLCSADTKQNVFAPRARHNNNNRLDFLLGGGPSHNVALSSLNGSSSLLCSSQESSRISATLTATWSSDSLRPSAASISFSDENQPGRGIDTGTSTSASSSLWNFDGLWDLSEAPRGAGRPISFDRINDSPDFMFGSSYYGTGTPFSEASSLSSTSHSSPAAVLRSTQKPPSLYQKANLSRSNHAAVTPTCWTAAEEYSIQRQPSRQSRFTPLCRAPADTVGYDNYRPNGVSMLSSLLSQPDIDGSYSFGYGSGHGSVPEKVQQRQLHRSISFDPAEDSSNMSSPNNIDYISYHSSSPHPLADMMHSQNGYSNSYPPPQRLAEKGMRLGISVDGNDFLDFTQLYNVEESPFSISRESFRDGFEGASLSVGSLDATCYGAAQSKYYTRDPLTSPPCPSPWTQQNRDSNQQGQSQSLHLQMPSLIPKNVFVQRQQQLQSQRVLRTMPNADSFPTGPTVRCQDQAGGNAQWVQNQSKLRSFPVARCPPSHQSLGPVGGEIRNPHHQASQQQQQQQYTSQHGSYVNEIGMRLPYQQQQRPYHQQIPKQQQNQQRFGQAVEFCGQHLYEAQYIKRAPLVVPHY